MSNLAPSYSSGILLIMWTCWKPSFNPIHLMYQGLEQVCFTPITVRTFANHQHSRHIRIRLLPHQQCRQVLDHWQLSCLGEAHWNDLLRQRIGTSRSQYYQSYLTANFMNRTRTCSGD